MCHLLCLYLMADDPHSDEEDNDEDGVFAASISREVDAYRYSREGCLRSVYSSEFDFTPYGESHALFPFSQELKHQQALIQKLINTLRSFDRRIRKLEVKALQHLLLILHHARTKALDEDEYDSTKKVTPRKRHATTLKHTPKAKKADSEDEDEYNSTKKVTPRKRYATKTETPKNAAKAVKRELSDAIIKDEMDVLEHEYNHGEV
ncbi:hypothetical protein ACHAO9_004706 [Fusarium lateritium]